MRHPETLDAFALGLLDGGAAAAVREHLELCGACRRDVRRLRAAAARAADSLAPVRPDPAVREATLASVRPRLARARRAVPRTGPPRGRWGTLWVPLVAGVAVLGAVTVAWDQQRSFRQAEGERAVVAAWLTRDDVTTWRLDAAGSLGRRPGSIMVADDGTVLVVLRVPAPAGSSYQVWGHGPDGPVPLDAGTGAVLRVDASGYREVGVSIEPRAGSPLPTDQLGTAPLPGRP